MGLHSETGAWDEELTRLKLVFEEEESRFYMGEEAGRVRAASGTPWWCVLARCEGKGQFDARACGSGLLAFPLVTAAQTS